MPEPITITTAIAALKPTFDALRSAMGLLKDAKELLPPGDQRGTVISQALVTAESSSKIAELEMAKALGYEFCRCEFPPIPMLTVGYTDNPGVGKNGLHGPVYECPKCGNNTALGWDYIRTAPRRGK
jgi:hypothetical protein